MVFNARSLITAGLLLLTACGVPKTRVEVAGLTPVATSPGGGLEGAGVYRIDPSESEVRLLVYRAGAMARLGHNHVIVNHSISGWVRNAANPSAASFVLTMAVTDFVIDDSHARVEEGVDFSEVVSLDAKAATRHNMLSPALLDGDAFPAITLASTGVSQDQDRWSARMSLNIAGHKSPLVVPFRLETSAGRASASGTVSLRQTDMGLVPFSVMLGALQVQDQIMVKFNLVAAAIPP